MTDHGPTPDPGFQPAGLDPLTLAAARDTGMPGFRIVATPPTASALPPIPPDESARRRHRDPWRSRLWMLAGFIIAFTLASATVDRLNPDYRYGDLPPAEWLAWSAIQVAIAVVVIGVVGHLIPRAFQRAKIRRMRAEATRSSGG